VVVGGVGGVFFFVFFFFGLGVVVVGFFFWLGFFFWVVGGTTLDRAFLLVISVQYNLVLPFADRQSSVFLRLSILSLLVVPRSLNIFLLDLFILFCFLLLRRSAITFLSVLQLLTGTSTSSETCGTRNPTFSRLFHEDLRRFIGIWFAGLMCSPPSPGSSPR